MLSCSRTENFPYSYSKVQKTSHESCTCEIVDSVDRSEQLSPRPQEKPPISSILYKPMLSVFSGKFPKDYVKKKGEEIKNCNNIWKEKLPISHTYSAVWAKSHRVIRYSRVTKTGIKWKLFFQISKNFTRPSFCCKFYKWNTRTSLSHFLRNCNPGKGWQIATRVSYKTWNVTCIQFFLPKVVDFHPTMQSYPGIITWGQAKLCS